ncbi:serine/threonine protein kinase [Streptomyces sp. R302]|uniref:serine/threonine-protein kinase n=1 Tax=unclassified Streptomyces TaxID=2593676 RepID=UPI00145FCBFA|nr:MULTISPECIES: serine/threonine-protein kinase [unclassified Streptomyces]NML55265.1 serine/threonine protein kinase [Streptomyces sp. R301]NML82685.1 serine/threonine protein kinase [Streptomyces sp. R302]
MTSLHVRADTPGRDDLPEGLPPGRRVGEWEVVEQIGTGGWSTVYAARPAPGHARTGSAARPPETTAVALKIMPTAGLAPLQARRIVESARREVALGRGAGHPRLIGLLDSFALSAPDHPSLDGAMVLVMERAAGSLRDLLDAGAAEADLDRVATGICEGLAHLHGAGWVHADLKPENVLLGEDGSVKLSDFGLATELTGTHAYVPPLGTLDYMPPERRRAPLGELGIQVRTSADVWALGIVLHELFAGGARPFPGATPIARSAAAQEYAAGRAPLRLDPAVPPFWRGIVADCLAPTHASRAPHTAESLLARIAARRPDGPGAPRRAFRRGTRAAVLAAVLCGTGAALCADTTGHGPGAPAGTVRVFNAERGCQERADRDRHCSLGLAIDPHRPYTAENVVRTRVWHGDLLTVDCRVDDGQPIVDEEDTRSTRWFRVRLSHASVPPDAWLPAVRTRDSPALPACRPPASR